MTVITNPHAWAVGTVKDGKFTIKGLSDTRSLARLQKLDGEVIRKVYIQPAEAVRMSR